MEKAFEESRGKLSVYAEGIMFGANKAWQEKMVEKAKNVERKVREQNEVVKFVKDQFDKTGGVLHEAIDWLRGEVAENVEERVRIRVEGFKEEVRAMIDEYLDDRIEEFVVKRRKIEEKSKKKLEEEKKSKPKASVDVVSEDEKKGENEENVSSTLHAPMEGEHDNDVLSVSVDRMSVSVESEEEIVIQKQKGALLERPILLDYDFAGNVDDDVQKYFEEYQFENHGRMDTNEDKSRDYFENNFFFHYVREKDDKSFNVGPKVPMLYFDGKTSFLNVNYKLFFEYAEMMPRAIIVSEDEYNGKTLNDLFFQNRHKVSLFLFVEYILERCTTHFTRMDYYLQLFVILHLKDLYQIYRNQAKLYWNDLFDVFFEDGFFDKIYNALSKNAKFSHVKDTLRKKDCFSLFDFFGKEILYGTYKSKFFHIQPNELSEIKKVDDYNFVKKFVTDKNSSFETNRFRDLHIFLEIYKNEEASSPESQFVPIESMD